VSGLLPNVTQKSEAAVQAGTPILAIGDPRDLEVVVDVLSTDAIEIHAGAAVTVEHWGGSGVLAGRVRRVEPATFTKISTLGVEEQRVNVLIDIVSPEKDWADLGDAYQVDARISVFTRDNATIVPAGALFSIGEKWNECLRRKGWTRAAPHDHAVAAIRPLCGRNRRRAARRSRHRLPQRPSRCRGAFQRAIVPGDANVMARTREWISAAARTDRPVQ
jgi:hypothetical protein